MNSRQMEKGQKLTKRKGIVSIIAAVLLCLLYMMIFSFSDQDGEQSSSISYFISEKCVEILNSISGRNWTELFMQDLTEYFEHPIRKLAHFSEYACMGILVYHMLRPWMERGKKLYVITVIWVFLSAAGDEFHQLFIPGRYGSFADVCLDTCGGAFGMIICIWIDRKICRKRLSVSKD